MLHVRFYFVIHCDMIVWKVKRIPLTYLTFREIKTHHFFLQKLQFAKVQADKEVGVLKNKIMDLERKLSQQGRTSQQDFQHVPQKRRRLSIIGKER